MCSVQYPGWLFDIGDSTTQFNIGIVISQYKDPYKPISIMECQPKGFFFTLLTCASLSLVGACFGCLFWVHFWNLASRFHNLRVKRAETCWFQDAFLFFFFFGGGKKVVEGFRK